MRQGWDWFFAPQVPVSQNLAADGVAFVYPRFDETRLAKAPTGRYIAWPPRRVGGDPAAYRAQWQQLADQSGPLRLVIAYSWNLYGERTQLEPTQGGPDYAGLTREYYRAYLSGGGQSRETRR